MLTSQFIHTMTFGLNTLCPKPGGAMSGTLKKCHARDSVIEKGRLTPPETTCILAVGRIPGRVTIDNLR